MAFGDVVGTPQKGNDGALATHTATLGVTATSGNLLVCGFSNGSSTGVISTPPSGWTLIEGYENADNNGDWHSYWKLSDGTETQAQLVWTAVARGEWFIVQYEWGQGTPSVTSNEDETNVATAVTSQGSGSLTPATANNIMLVIFGGDDSVGFTLNDARDGSWVEDLTPTGVSTSYASIASVGRLVDAAVSSQSATKTHDTATNCWGCIVSFDVATGGDEPLVLYTSPGLSVTQ